MRPTNYHLFDFMDFDTDLKRDESLWKAYKPTSVREKDGDILVEVPFQKQQLANDMAPDTDVLQETQTLVIRQYEPESSASSWDAGESNPQTPRRCCR